MMNNSNKMGITRKISGFFIAAILILSFAAALPSSVMAQMGYTDINAEQAYQLIQQYSSSEILILDVRNQSEYTFEHLYNSLQIPYYLLEDIIEVYQAFPNATIIDCRSVKLMEHINDPIIVYCAKGTRSEIACTILVENGFTEVYNMIGGIESWLRASLPIYNTAHKVTIENDEGNSKITIDPLQLPNCTACGQGQSSNWGDGIENVEVTNVEQNETCIEAQVTFDLNGTTFENLVSQNILWTYASGTDESNLTASFLSIDSIGDLNTQYYLLQYQIQHVEYNFSVATKLEPLDIDTYSASGTVVRFLPIGKTELQSIELVNFTSPVTLSGLYRSLEQVCEKLAGTYQKEGKKYNENILKGLAHSYAQMTKGLQSLSKLVKNELGDYDRTILQNLAVLTDDSCSDCQWWCGLLIGYVTCSFWDILLGYTICAALGFAGGVPGFICGVIWTLVVGAICYVGVPPYCYNICQYGGYCTPQTHYVSVIRDYAPFGNGHVTNVNGLLGSADDGNSVHIYGYSNGDGGNIAGNLDASAHGDIRLRAMTGVNTRVYVYIATTYGSWLLVNSIWISPAPGYASISFGSVTADFRYVAIAAYDANAPSNLYVDNLKVVS